MEGFAHLPAFVQRHLPGQMIGGFILFLYKMSRGGNFFRAIIFVFLCFKFCLGKHRGNCTVFLECKDLHAAGVLCGTQRNQLCIQERCLIRIAHQHKICFLRDFRHPH